MVGDSHFICSSSMVGLLDLFLKRREKSLSEKGMGILLGHFVGDIGRDSGLEQDLRNDFSGMNMSDRLRGSSDDLLSTVAPGVGAGHVSRILIGAVEDRGE